MGGFELVWVVFGVELAWWVLWFGICVLDCCWRFWVVSAVANLMVLVGFGVGCGALRILGLSGVGFD